MTQFRPSRKLWQKIIYICIYRFFVIRVEKKFYGDWSKETRQLLADGDALAAYKRRAFDLYRQRFAPEALLRRVDAWNERGAPDDWQDS